MRSIITVSFLVLTLVSIASCDDSLLLLVYHTDANCQGDVFRVDLGPSNAKEICPGLTAECRSTESNVEHACVDPETYDISQLSTYFPNGFLGSVTLKDNTF